MARVDLSDIHVLEERIQGLKNSIAKISEERWRATLSRDDKAVLLARFKASEKTLENCHEIANYLNHFSPPLASEIRTREKNAKSSLEQIKRTGNANELHMWIKNELIPSTKMSERFAHLLASSIRTVQGEDLEFYKWSKPR